MTDPSKDRDESSDADVVNEADDTETRPEESDDDRTGDVVDESTDSADETKEKPAATGNASRSGNPARAAEADDEPTTRPVKPKKVGNRWAAPAMLTSAAIGLIWIVLYYVFSDRENPIPLMNDLGDWNLIVGMVFIVAAFGFSMKWE